VNNIDCSPPHHQKKTPPQKTYHEKKRLRSIRRPRLQALLLLAADDDDGTSVVRDLQRLRTTNGNVVRHVEDRIVRIRRRPRQERDTRESEGKRHAEVRDGSQPSCA